MLPALQKEFSTWCTTNPPASHHEGLMIILGPSEVNILLYNVCALFLNCLGRIPVVTPEKNYWGQGREGRILSRDKLTHMLKQAPAPSLWKYAHRELIIMDIEMRGCACVHLNVSTYTYSIVANRLLLMQISIQYMKYLSFRLLQRLKNWKKIK